jgi:hypothetical protein
MSAIFYRVKEAWKTYEQILNRLLFLKGFSPDRFSLSVFKKGYIQKNPACFGRVFLFERKLRLSNQ